MISVQKSEHPTAALYFLSSRGKRNKMEKPNVKELDHPF